MAIVPQEVILFSGSILENIRFGLTSASEEEIIDAAKKANAWEFISTFPEGLLTEVGDRGIQLSGGQKQRIALARAILRDPAIIILDEFTSQSDPESEALIHKVMKDFLKGRTSFVITHRLNTLEIASRIIVLDAGIVAAVGTHKELIENSAVYKRMFEVHGKRLSA